MTRVGVIGYGYWGPKLVRNFRDADGAEVSAVADLDESRLELLAAHHPLVRGSASPDDIIDDPAIDAVVIATPVESHFELAMAALCSGKHVLVEKPMTMNSREAAQLVAIASQRTRVLMVDHTFVHSSAVREIRRLLETGAIGTFLFYHSVRTSFDRFHPGVGVVWDLAIHDAAILDYLLNEEPSIVSATGLSTVPSGPPDLAAIALRFAGQRVAHIQVDWLSSVKLRRTVVGGSRGTILYDGLDAAEPVKVFESGDWTRLDRTEAHALRVGHRTGKTWAPRLSPAEPLQRVVAHFLECIKQGRSPETDGRSASRTARWLEAANESISLHGQPVELSPVACR